MNHTPTESASTPLQALVDALLHDRAVLVARLGDEIQAQLPLYREIPIETFAAELGLQIEQILHAARDDRQPAPEHQAELLTIGQQRALQGLPLADVLRAWRLGVRAAIAYAREVGRRLGIAPERMLDLVDALLGWSDVAIITIAEGHRNTELELARQDQERRAAFVRGVLLNLPSAASIRIQADGYGLDPTRTYVAVRARPTATASLHELHQHLGFAHPHCRGFSTLIDDDLAGFLPAPPAGDAPGIVGVGPPRPLQRLCESFRLATRALITAESFGLQGIHTFAQLGLRPAIVADTDVDQVMIERYIAPLGNSDSAAEILATLDVYFACGMHVDSAAQRLFVHPNTLRYRLGRFEKLTGADLHDAQVAFEVWWGVQRSAIRTADDLVPD